MRDMAVGSPGWKEMREFFFHFNFNDFDIFFIIILKKVENFFIIYCLPRSPHL